MVALFAALIVPWVIQWNDYKAIFEVEAEKILGQPVRVTGSLSATLLPSPSLTIVKGDDDAAAVQIGGTADDPMMTVDRFAVTIELMPLLQGEIRVVSMKLDRPQVEITVDDRGATDWLRRTEASKALDPEKVILEGVEISNGALHYVDARSDIALDFEQINALVEARSLSGPWRIEEGSYLHDGERVRFDVATGLRLDDGSMRVKVDFRPARWPIEIAADGVIANPPQTGPVYRGTYNVSEINAGAGDPAAASADDFTGWRSEGSFVLNRDRLVIDKAIVSKGPADRPSSVAAALTVGFGAQAAFEASVEARQLDLDRALGGGPTEPVEVSAAAARVVAWLTALPVPPIPGRISFDVPGIVVGGSLIQDVSFTAEPASAGWRIDEFHARLPGQASLDANGLLATTAARFGFEGFARLAVSQPATFAAWWRGRSQHDAGRLLAAFDIAGDTKIAPGRIAVDRVEARIGDARITGSFDWGESTVGLGRELGMDLKADRIDFSQVKALAELLAGRNLNDTAVLADSYSIRLAAGAFAFEDIRMREVAVDLAYAEDMLTVVQLAIGDLGGASFRVTSGRIDDLTTNPFGHLNATLEATTLAGVGRIVDRFLPNSRLAGWLDATSKALAPAVIKAKVIAPAVPGGTGFRVELEGVAGATSFTLAADSSGNLANWRGAGARLDAVFDSPDTAGLARQIGLSALAVDADTGAHVEIRGGGVPGDGLDTTIIGELAGATANASGKLAFAADLAPSFAGTFGVTSDDLDPVIAMAGLGIPGAAIGTAVDLDGTIAISADGAKLEWRNGSIGGHLVGGEVSLARAADRTWRIGGNLDVDEADLGWIMALGLGFAPMPTGDPAVPWSKTPFISPVYGPLTGKLAVTAEHLAVGDGLDVANTRFDLRLQPRRIDLDLTAGQIAGGSVTGGFSIHNVAGNANFVGRFNLKGAALESFVWQLDGRSVATGVFDLSANFEATGRSPAALVSSATGGGVIAIRDGQARYVNPNAARLLVRASDLGQQYSEDALRLSFSEVIDGDTLAFGDADSAFAIAAGAVRVNNLTLRTTGFEAIGNAVIDLNTTTIESDWTLTFDPGDAKVAGTDPRVGIVFRGPIDSPGRSVDVLQLASYLNMRQEVRMLEIIAMEEATRAEKDRLTRLVGKLRDDAARREREARAAREAEARRRAAALAANAALERLHVRGQIIAGQRRVAALRSYAERAAAEQVEADNAAAEATHRVAAERERAESARAALARAIAAEREAITGATAAATALAEARTAAAAADQAAATAVAAAEVADAAAVRARAAAAQANDRATRAATEEADAGAALAAAVAEAGEAGVAANEAGDRATAAERALDAARGVMAEAERALAAAVAALSDAEAQLDAAEADADEKNAVEAIAADAAKVAAARKSEADAALAKARGAAATAAEARAAAGKRAEEAKASAVAAQTQADAASTTAEAAATVAAALLADEDADEEARAAARDMQTIERVATKRAKARQAAADEAGRRATAARAGRDRAEAQLAEARAKLAAATAAAEEAAEADAHAADAAEQAAAANFAAVKAMTAATEAREAAAGEASLRQAAAGQAAAAALAEAEDAARVAAARARAARVAAAGVLENRAAAEVRVARVAKAAAQARTAAEAAASALTEALADQTTARTAADRASTSAVAAAAVLAERARADADARQAVKLARRARGQAERVAAEAEAAAAQAANAAESAAREAAAKAAAAKAAERAAQRAAQRAAEGAGPFDAGAAEAVADQNQAASLSPVEASGSAASPDWATVPIPRRPPPSLVFGEPPLAITPVP